MKSVASCLFPLSLYYLVVSLMFYWYRFHYGLSLLGNQLLFNKLLVFEVLNNISDRVEGVAYVQTASDTSVMFCLPRKETNFNNQNRNHPFPSFNLFLITQSRDYAGRTTWTWIPEEGKSDVLATWEWEVKWGGWALFHMPGFFSFAYQISYQNKNFFPFLLNLVYYV